MPALRWIQDNKEQIKRFLSAIGYDHRLWARSVMYNRCFPMIRGLDVQIPDGGGVSWTCTFSADASACGNMADSCCFTFGGKVETQEHCNAFVYYYPKVADYSCF